MARSRATREPLRAPVIGRTDGTRASCPHPGILLLAVLLLAAPLAADPSLERTDALPPDLPDWLSTLLDPAGYRVVRDEGEPIEFWLPPTLPMQNPAGELGVEYGSLPPGSLIGVMRTAGEWSTYKSQVVPAGTYTLRYAVQPPDGDHTGQTWFRDFLLLIPLALDNFDPYGVPEQEPLVEVSNTIIEGGTHPMTLALFQIYDEVDGPGMYWNDLDQPTLAIPMGDVTLGLVIEGQGEEVPL